MAPSNTTRARSAAAVAVASSADARWLTRSERRQWRTLPTPAARADYLASRIAAKRALSRIAAGVADAHGIAVLRREHRTPLVAVRGAVGWRRARVALSLAHRDGRAIAIAAPRGWRVGADVERARAIPPEHARWFASAAERARGPRDASALWALKEAAWKALRLGPDVPLCALALDLDDGGRLRGVRVPDACFRARARIARPFPDHVVALVHVRGAR